MRLKWTLGILLIAVLHIVICQRGGPSDNTDETFDVSAANLELVSNSVTNLAQRISLAMKDNNNAKTEIFSPVSIAGALSLLLLGAGGVTKNEIMSLMGFQNQQISFADIHRSFGKLFSELVSNEPTLQANIPWRENDKCNIPDDYDDEDVGSRGSFQHHRGTAGRPKRDTESPHIISVANGIFINRDLRLSNQYSELTRSLYGAEVRQLDFRSDPSGSSSAINEWVRAKTRGKIHDIVTSETINEAPMVLTSALYFKAKWVNMFVVPNTKPRPFYLNGRQQPPIDVETMATSGCFPFYDATEINAKIVGLPYEEGKSTMYILMPNESDRQKLRTLLQGQRFNLHQFNRMIDNMQVKSGTIVMPKMKIENTIQLKEILIRLNVQSVFDPVTSNLTGITREDNRLESPIRRQPPSQIELPSAPASRPQTAIVFPSDWVQQPSSPSKLRIALNPEACNLINTCTFSGQFCECDQNLPVLRNQLGCHPKPLLLSTQCQSKNPIVTVNGLKLCVAESYVVSRSAAQDRCKLDGCYYINERCFCCNAAANQYTENVPREQVSPAVQQNNISTIPSFEVANRFEETTIAPNPRNCQIVRYCSNYRCNLYRLCAPINNQVAGMRPKRQLNTYQHPNLFAGQIVHKVSLDVNEHGTEGGAVTTVVIDRISSSFTMRMDGPFLIYIRNDITRLPLFYGPVYDPRP